MAACWHFIVFLTLVLEPVCVYSFIEGLYCGVENCYDILDVTRDSSRSEVVKAYRKLARKWHPDMHKTEEGKQTASVMFQKIANAYEILRDDEQRDDYNYMLDNPDEYYSIYFQYYRRRVAPKVDIRVVIGVTITIISILQYLGAWNNYKAAIDYLCKETKYRTKAIDIAKREGMFNYKKKDKRSKAEIREEEEAVIRKIIEENLDIRGGYSKPSYTDVLWIQLILLPYYIVMYISWWLRWVWKFYILRENYGDEEKLYLIKKYMKANKSQWEAMDDYEKEKFLAQELWIKENYEVWFMKQEEERKSKLAESARYKSYRRYMKKGGAGQMTFGPE